MKYRRVINEPIDIEEEGVSIKGGVNAVVAANVNESSPSSVSSRQKVRIVQREGKTEVFEHETEESTDG